MGRTEQQIHLGIFFSEMQRLLKSVTTKELDDRQRIEELERELAEAQRTIVQLTLGEE